MLTRRSPRKVTFTIQTAAVLLFATHPGLASPLFLDVPTPANDLAPAIPTLPPLATPSAPIGTGSTPTPPQAAKVSSGVPSPPATVQGSNVSSAISTVTPETDAGSELTCPDGHYANAENTSCLRCDASSTNVVTCENTLALHANALRPSSSEMGAWAPAVTAAVVGIPVLVCICIALGAVWCIWSRQKKAKGDLFGSKMDSLKDFSENSNLPTRPQRAWRKPGGSVRVGGIKEPPLVKDEASGQREKFMDMVSKAWQGPLEPDRKTAKPAQPSAALSAPHSNGSEGGLTADEQRSALIPTITHIPELARDLEVPLFAGKSYQPERFAAQNIPTIQVHQPDSAPPSGFSSGSSATSNSSYNSQGKPRKPILAHRERQKPRNPGGRIYDDVDTGRSVNRELIRKAALDEFAYQQHKNSSVKSSTPSASVDGSNPSDNTRVNTPATDLMTANDDVPLINFVGPRPAAPTVRQDPRVLRLHIESGTSSSLSSSGSSFRSEASSASRLPSPNGSTSSREAMRARRDMWENALFTPGSMLSPVPPYAATGVPMLMPHPPPPILSSPDPYHPMMGMLSIPPPYQIYFDQPQYGFASNSSTTSSSAASSASSSTDDSRRGRRPGRTRDRSQETSHDHPDTAASRSESRARSTSRSRSRSRRRDRSQQPSDRVMDIRMQKQRVLNEEYRKLQNK
ncbi:uncharacterized protein EV422DRAFT_154805 [Fimicolochytrium jonesii]|uniref:uncharacterized protein n=1 Tax=Fimicolochytrium jonesii TaxID=1396493 RepID=UPI0022FE5DE9|nr:uncharacterized protein EV422DRAFT_154805 [Fimicolochytrium jonesii]KAI8826117.1 hypothetical protein EV422DRAFT_154805 [Fimicolochytrium jonesii]